MAAAHHTGISKATLLSTAVVLLAMLLLPPAACSGQQSSNPAPYGAYLGCFDPAKLLMDDAIKARGVALFYRHRGGSKPVVQSANTEAALLPARLDASAAGMMPQAAGLMLQQLLRDHDVYTLSNKESAFSEIDVEMMNGNPAVPGSIWLNSFFKGMSQGETLVRPEAYQQLLNLPPSVSTTNTFFTFGISWQPDSVIWSLNGVPLQRRYYDQQVSWTEMDGRKYTKRYRPPHAASHVTFSIWSDNNQTRGFGGRLDIDQSPYFSRFRSLRRILCDQAFPNDPDEAAAARGPSWLYASSSSRAASRRDGNPSVAATSGLHSLASQLSAGATLATSVGGSRGFCLTSGQTLVGSAGLLKLGVLPCSSSSVLWVYDASKQTLSFVNNGVKICLSEVDGYPGAQTCDESGATAGQIWQLLDGGKFQSSTGVCLGVGGSSLRPELSEAHCGSEQELTWAAGVPDVLQYLEPAKPLVTYNPEFGYCLEPARPLSSGTDAAAAPATVVKCGFRKSPAAFYFQPSTRQIVMKGTKTCLTAGTSSGEVFIAPCAEASRAAAAQEMKQQTWTWVGGKHLKTIQGACLRVQGLDGVVKLADCGSDVEAAWAFGTAAEYPLLGLNPGKALTTVIDRLPFFIDVVVETVKADGSKDSWLGLKPRKGNSNGGLAFKFNSTTRQIKAVGAENGFCLTARGAVKGVQLLKCQAAGGPYSRAQSWTWFAGQLKNEDDGGCLAAWEPLDNAESVDDGSENRQLTLEPCSQVADANRVTWSFDGEHYCYAD
eukprot:gene9620-9781_t